MRTNERYLISGMPRSRTAWLTAVLRAHGSMAYHDVYARGLALHGEYGVIDPAVALLTPYDGIFEYDGCPTFCLVSDSLSERLTALEKAADITFTDRAREVFADNYETFARNTVQISVHDLDDDDKVGEIVRECTKQASSLNIISTFQLLRIEEHMPKARQLHLPGRQSMSAEYLKSFERMKPGTSIVPDAKRMGHHTQPSTISGSDIDPGQNGRVIFTPLTIRT